MFHTRSLLAFLCMGAALVSANPLFEEIQKQSIRLGAGLASGDFVLQADQEVLENTDTCWECTAKASECFLGEIKSHLKDFCEKSKCPYVKKVCEDAEKHTAFTEGAIMDHSRVFHLGYSYCMGMKKCSSHGDGEGDGEDDIVRLSELVLTAMKDLKNNFDYAKLTELNSATCRDCITDSSINMAYYYYEDAKQMCHKYSPKCEKVKWLCSKFLENKDRALGIITSHFNTMGEGIAYCFGDRSCHKHERLVYWDEFFKRYDERRIHEQGEQPGELIDDALLVQSPAIKIGNLQFTETPQAVYHELPMNEIMIDDRLKDRLIREIQTFAKAFLQ